MDWGFESRADARIAAGVEEEKPAAEPEKHKKRVPKPERPTDSAEWEEPLPRFRRQPGAQPATREGAQPRHPHRQSLPVITVRGAKWDAEEILQRLDTPLGRIEWNTRLSDRVRHELMRVPEIMEKVKESKLRMD